MIGFTCGSFDLLHAGHVLMFKECKKYCDYLIVGLQVDPSLDREFKNKPIQTVFERQVQLNAIKFIDEVLVYETENDLLNILKALDIQIRFIGEEYRDSQIDFTGKYLDSFETRYTSRKHSYSSTNLRKRIKDD